MCFRVDSSCRRVDSNGIHPDSAYPRPDSNGFHAKSACPRVDSTGIDSDSVCRRPDSSRRRVDSSPLTMDSVRLRVDSVPLWTKIFAFKGVLANRWPERGLQAASASSDKSASKRAEAIVFTHISIAWRWFVAQVSKPAVSPTSSRQGVGKFGDTRTVRRLRIGNPRYRRLEVCATTAEPQRRCKRCQP